MSSTAQVVQSLEPFIISVAVPAIVQVVKSIAEKMPTWLAPILAGALGPGLDQLAAFLAQAPSNPTLAVVYGLAGVGVREVLNQAGKRIAQ